MTQHNHSEQDDAFKQAAKLASASAVDGYASALGLKKNQSELDEAIQKFAAYARHEGDFDELDLKEVVSNHTADVLGRVLHAITPDMTRGEIVQLINNKRKELAHEAGDATA